MPSLLSSAQLPVFRFRQASVSYHFSASLLMWAILGIQDLRGAKNVIAEKNEVRTRASFRRAEIKYDDT
jgi:hypothetical protein